MVETSVRSISILQMRKQWATSSNVGLFIRRLTKNRKAAQLGFANSCDPRPRVQVLVSPMYCRCHNNKNDNNNSNHTNDSNNGREHGNYSTIEGYVGVILDTYGLVYHLGVKLLGQFDNATRRRTECGCVRLEMHSPQSVKNNHCRGSRHKC